MKRISVCVMAACVTAFAGCAKDASFQALLKTVKGSAEIERAGKKSPAKEGDKLSSGDVLLTGADGVAVVVFRDNLAQAEVQPNASFRIDAQPGRKDVKLDRGAMWIKVNKQSSKDEFAVHTPTTIAGVRGTKFYTAQFDGYVAVCHCEGDVDFSASTYKSTHHTDTLVFSKNGKTVALTVADLEPGMPYNHDHSALDDSPIGAKNSITPEMRRNLVALIEKKMKAMK